MPDRAISQFDGLGGVLYDRYIQSARLSAALGRLQWSSNARAMRSHMEAAVRSVPRAATVIDVPCGGGLLLRWLDPAAGVRWLAVDGSPTMLERTGRLAARFGIGGVETLRADALRLPLEDDIADVVMAYNGLHHFADAPGALREALRCMRPGARLHGCMLLEGESPSSDRLIALYRRLGLFGPGGTRSDLRRWLQEAGFADAAIACDGAIACFDARRPPG
jgi:ubiquinone/menaquinone biosynthesis C-methylase UbiE